MQRIDRDIHRQRQHGGGVDLVDCDGERSCIVQNRRAVVGHAHGHRMEPRALELGGCPRGLSVRQHRQPRGAAHQREEQGVYRHVDVRCGECGGEESEFIQYRVRNGGQHGWSVGFGCRSPGHDDKEEVEGAFQPVADRGNKHVRRGRLGGAGCPCDYSALADQCSTRCFEQLVAQHIRRDVGVDCLVGNRQQRSFIDGDVFRVYHKNRRRINWGWRRFGDNDGEKVEEAGLSVAHHSDEVVC